MNYIYTHINYNEYTLYTVVYINMSFQKCALLVLCTRRPSIVLTPVMRNSEF